MSYPLLSDYIETIKAAEELEYVSSTFLTPIKYLDKELFVDTNASDDTEFPVLLMDWVEGPPLCTLYHNERC